MVVAGSVLLAGCFDGSDSAPDSDVRIVHASSDAPAVNVRVNGDIVVSGADYKQAAVLKPDAGVASIAVDGLLPGGGTATVIDADGVSLRSDTKYDVIAVGKVGDSTIEPLILSDDGARDDANSARLRVAHLSPGAETAAGGPVDVYLTAFGDPLPAEATFSFSFKESVGPLEVPAADNYQIRVTPAGSDAVVYDSGEIALPAGADLLVGAVDNTVYGNAPVSLLVLNGAQVTEILDAGTGAGIRAVHNSSAPTPNVDIYLNEEPDGSPAASNVAFGETVPGAPTTGSYVALNAGENRVVVTATGVTGSTAIDATLDLAGGDLKTVIAAGVLADGLDTLVFDDNNRRVATEAKLRVIHGAVEAPTVDVFLVPTDAGGTGSTLIGNSMPALDDFTFGESSGYVGVAAGDYVVFITSEDGATELYKSPSLSLEAGGVYTAVARLNESQDSVATVTLLDDFIPEPQ
jgi:hypothetical protein